MLRVEAPEARGTQAPEACEPGHPRTAAREFDVLACLRHSLRLLVFATRAARVRAPWLLLTCLVATVALPERVGAQEDDASSDWGSGAEETASAEEQAPPPEPAAPTRRTPSARAALSPSDAQLAGADMDLERWDQELRQVQRQTRAYFGAWFVGQSALIGMNLYIAMTTPIEARRMAYTVGTALSGANFLYLLVQGWPALGSHKRFRAMPSSSLQEKVEKATYAQEIIEAQRHKDRLVNGIERHIGAFVVGAGVGFGIGLGYKDLYEGLSIGIGVFAIAELLILTRPNTYHTPEKRPTLALKNLKMSPWADKYARGIGLAGQF